MGNKTLFMERFEATHKKSKALWERATKLGRGYHTDPIVTRPFSLYVTHAKGSKKWDVDGNEYIDYVMGFGAMFLGYTLYVVSKNGTIRASTLMDTERGLSCSLAALL